MTVVQPPLQASSFLGDPLAEEQPTGTTVVFRKLKGEPQFVVVCGDCAVIQVIEVRDAMRVALGRFLDEHHRHDHRKGA